MALWAGISPSADDGVLGSAISSCNSVGPAPAKCDIEGSTMIDHKVLASDKLDGAQTSTQLGLISSVLNVRERLALLSGPAEATPMGLD